MFGIGLVSGQGRGLGGELRPQRPQSGGGTVRRNIQEIQAGRELQHILVQLNDPALLLAGVGKAGFSLFRRGGGKGAVPEQVIAAGGYPGELHTVGGRGISGQWLRPVGYRLPAALHGGAGPRQQAGGQSDQEEKEQQRFPHGYSSPLPSIRSSAWSTRPGS